MDRPHINEYAEPPWRAEPGDTVSKPAEPEPATEPMAMAAESWWTIREVLDIAELVLSAGQLGSIGQEASRRCRRAGIEPRRKFDGRRQANSYPPTIVRELAPGVLAMVAAGPDAREGGLPDGGRWRAFAAWKSASDLAAVAAN